MSEKFQWTTEEERDWEEITTSLPPDSPANRPRSRRRWLLVLLAALVVGGLLWQQARRQVTAVTGEVTADILSSQALLEQAQQQSDLELFTTVLSGRDAGWTAAQQALFSQDLLWDRQPLGLSLLPTDPAIISLTVAPDMQSAEMLVARQYVVGEAGTPAAYGRDAFHKAQPATTAAEVSLLLPLTFRKGESRWLLAPPPAEYWGGWQETKGYFVTLIYPERDAEVAGRLLAEMDAQVKALCRFEPAADCRGDWQLMVRLDTDPASLTAVADPDYLFHSGPVFALPTPSLVGLPADEAGYRVLAQVYADQVVNRAIVDVVAARQEWRLVALEWPRQEPQNGG